MSSMSVPATKVGVDFGHEFAHALAAVIARHVVMQIFPESLDAVVIGTVRWKEMQANAPADG